MKKTLLALMIISLLLSYARADEFEFLKKGTPAPFDGYIVTPEKERNLRLTNEQLKISEDTLKLQNEKISIYEKRLQIRDTQIDALSNRVVEQKDESFFTKAGMFILGAVVTTGIVYGVSRVSK